MRRMKVRLSALAIAFCAVLAVVFCGGVARADEDYSFALTVNATASTDTAFVAEVKRADLVLDVYKLADAVYDSKYDTYSYDNWATGFESVKTNFDAIQEASKHLDQRASGADWQTLYDEAAAVVKDNNIEPKYKDVAFTDGKAEVEIIEKGLYLVMARGADEDNGAGFAYSDRYKFTFPATMVVAPTKWADETTGDMSADIYTDWVYGEWHDEATLNLKSSQEPIYGRLIIDKAIIEGYEGEETTFVFRVQNVETDEVAKGELYDEYASITLNGESTGTTQLTHIPAQIRVEIEETYYGGRYEYVSTEWLTDNVIISDHDIDERGATAAEVLVNNKRGNNTPGGGHGIENHFEYDSETGDWPLDMRPYKPYNPTATTE